MLEARANHAGGDVIERMGVLHEQQKTRERGLRGRRLHGSTEKKPLEHQRERLTQTRHALARAQRVREGVFASL